MKKYGVLFVFLFLCLISIVNAASYEGNLSSSKEEVLVELSFHHTTVTTKNIDEKLPFPYKLRGGKVKQNLQFIDEAIQEQLNQINTLDVEETEKDYKKILERYVLYDDLEKINRIGVPLEKITILVSSQYLTQLQQIGCTIRYLS